MPGQPVAAAIRAAASQYTVWSPQLVQQAVLHPVSVRLYADSPYLADLYRPDLASRIVHPAEAPVGNFARPIHLAGAPRRWYLPGSAADLLLHTSCVIACQDAVVRHLDAFSDANDLGPPLLSELSAGSFGDRATMFAYWEQMDARTRHPLDSGFSHVVITDIRRCIESMDPRRTLNLLRQAGSCPDAVRVLSAMHESWERAGCRGLPLVAGFRLLIKLYLKEVDDRLRAEGISFIRLQDDFRLFCLSERDAAQALAVLTEALTASGLSLNREKTLVLPAGEFRRSWQKRMLDCKRTFSRGVLFPFLSDSLRVPMLRPAVIRLLRAGYSRRWTPA
jgi:hypothetical protein